MKLDVKGVFFSYNSRPALNGVTLGVEAGEVVTIVGPNGSGKTTLLKCIDRILKPKIGTILVEGQDAGKMDIKKLAKLLSYVPQSADSVFPYTAFDVILIGRRPHLSWGVSENDREVVSQALELMGLSQMALRPISELSSGERQKVLIAKALAQEPQVLLLDEPTSNLDLRAELEVLGLIERMVEERGITAIMAMHDLNLASRFSQRIILLKEGKVYATGKPGSVLTPENIRSAYGVEALVENGEGSPHIVALRPV
jgi:iron complex transport system ATP-binding protein